MRDLFLHLTIASVFCCAGLTTAMQAQSDAAKIYKTNCTLCHGDNGSGEGPTGKALHAKDLRSDEVQKESDATLNEIIAKGKGKMPAFGAKIKPDDITKMVAYIRALPQK